MTAPGDPPPGGSFEGPLEFKPVPGVETDRVAWVDRACAPGLPPTGPTERYATWERAPAPCAPCAASPKDGSGHPRRCAFAFGAFRPDSLNCATFDILNDWTQRNRSINETWNDGQAVQVFARGGKFLIVGRYHSKPYRTEACVIVEDDKVNAAPTFADVAPFLEGRT